MLKKKLFSKNTLCYLLEKVNSVFKIGYVPCSGRNNKGIICVRHKGGNAKRRFFLIDYYKRINQFGFILKIFKTGFRNSLIGLILYRNGLSCYTILSEDCLINNYIYSGSLISKDLIFTSGTSIPLNYLGLFSIINNLEIRPFTGSKFVRSAGMGAIIIARANKTTTVKLSTKYVFTISNFCMCSIGLVSNSHYKYFSYKKAGYKRSLGIRPTVRGVAMNPCDHPHGGGEGRKSPLVSAKSPWGKLCKQGQGRKINVNKLFKNYF